MLGTMLIESTGRGWRIHTPAKVNLFLEVLRKRADGFHEIDTIMCPVSLFDRLEFEPTESPGFDFSVVACDPSDFKHLSNVAFGSSFNASRRAENVCENPVDPAWDIPQGEGNLIVRALKAVLQAVDSSSDAHRFRGCRVRLQKWIPAAAGMGGGSSDAASAIVAGLLMWFHWDRQLALRIASSLGSDIPLFLGDTDNGIGLARATGRGEHVEILSGRPPLCFVISHPPVGSSTAEVYKLWRSSHAIRSSNEMIAACQQQSSPRLPMEQGTSQQGQAVALSRSVDSSSSNRSMVEQAMFNALQTPARTLTDWIDRQLENFAKLGKTRAMMSGSGSACFALVENLDEGRQLAQKMIELGLPRAYVAEGWYAASIEQQLERITTGRN